MVPARGVERWLTQRLSHRLGVGPRAATGSARASGSSSPRSLVSLLHRPRARRPVGPRPPGLAAARHHRRQPRRALVRDPRRPPRPRPHRRTTPSCAATAATAWRSGWRRCSRRTPSSGRRSSPTGARAATPTAPAGASTPTWPGSPSCGGGCSPGSTRRRPTSATPRPSRRCATGGAGLDLPPRLSLFGHTRLPGDRGRAARRARRAPRRPPLPAAGLAGALGRPGRDSAASSPATTTTSAELVGHPLLASLGRDARELRRTLDGAGFPHGDAVRRPTTEPATLLGLLQHDLRANHAPDDRRARRPPPRPGRPQPPGARLPRPGPPGRRAARGAGRAARRTTRPSSRATSW